MGGRPVGLWMTSLLVLIIALCVACSPKPPASTVPAPRQPAPVEQGVSSDAVKSSGLRQLTLGLIPAESNESQVDHFEPVRAYLEQKLGLRVKMFVATDYAGVIEAMKNGKVDIAWFGPLSYVLAERVAGAEAFAVGVDAKGKSTYRSGLYVKADSPYQTLADLKGKQLALVDPASTSGNLVPRYLVLKETRQKAEEFFGKVVYAGGHDAAQLQVKNGTVEVAGSNDETNGRLVETGALKDRELRCVLQSDPLPGSPLAYRGSLPPAVKQAVAAILTSTPADVKLTGYGHTVRYQKASPDDYKLVRDLVQKLGLTDKELLK